MIHKMRVDVEPRPDPWIVALETNKCPTHCRSKVGVSVTGFLACSYLHEGRELILVGGGSPRVNDAALVA